jgi:hypothetical protein
MVSLSNHEDVALRCPRSPPWFDRLTMRSLGPQLLRGAWHDPAANAICPSPYQGEARRGYPLRL